MLLAPMPVTEELSSPSESSQLVQKDLYVSNLQTLMHLVKGNVGVNVLALPWAIKHAGVVLGPILLVILAITSSSCTVTLVKCSRHFCSKLGVPALNYGDVAFYSFLFGPFKCLQRHATKARYGVNFLISFTQFGACCMCFVFVAQNTRQVVALYWHDAPEDRVFIALLWIPIVLLVSIRDLSKLAWFSGVANAVLFTAICMIFRFFFTHLVPLESRPFVASIADFPLFLGIAAFSFEGMGLVWIFASKQFLSRLLKFLRSLQILPIENVMRTPEDFRKVFYTAMAIIFLLFMSVGFFGYLTFGPAICGSVTLNLPTGTLFYQIVRIFLSIAMLMSYGLQFYVGFQIVWIPIAKKMRRQTMYCELLTRTAFVTLTCFLAISIPYIGDFYSLVGATGAIALQYIFPSIIEVVTYHSKAGSTEYPELISTGGSGESLLLGSSGDQETDKEDDAQPGPRSGLSVWTVIKNTLIVTLGLVGMLTGTIVSVMKIVRDLQNYSSGNTCSGGLGINSLIVHSNSTTHSMPTVVP